MQECTIAFYIHAALLKIVYICAEMENQALRKWMQTHDDQKLDPSLIYCHLDWGPLEIIFSWESSVSKV